MTGIIPGTYDSRLVGLSIGLAMLASFAALDLAGRVTASTGTSRSVWLVFGALAMGLGIWSMHYIGMLAFALPIPVAYDWPTVLLSLAAAIGASALALGIVSRPVVGRGLLVLGGLAMGAGIAAMHYIGMDAMRLDAMCVYTPWIVAVSIVIAIVVSIVALRFAYHFRTEPRLFARDKFLGAAAMGTAIALMHYSAMAAVTFVAMPEARDAGHSLVITSLELANIVVVTAIVLTVAIVTSFADRRFAAQDFELRKRTDSVLLLSGLSAKREQRIEALAHVARDSDALSFDARARAILNIATATIRPARTTIGILSHLDRGTVIIDSVDTHDPAHDSAIERVLTILYPGSTFVLERSMHASLFQAGKTLAWDDIASETLGLRSMVCVEFGVLSMIGTTVNVGSKVHFVVFMFLEPMTDDPLADEDLAFVDVVAAFLANGYQRELQAERLSYQMEHDAMTGLGNRIQMRRAAVACVVAQDDFAIAVLNLDRFREINLSFGQLIGDELLVEVAMMLASVDDRDLVSRRNGDEFTILLRGANVADIDRRIARYVQTFATPFNTGDRDGTRLLSVGCSFGVALFPRDGKTIDAIMLRAEVALDIAKQRGGGELIFDAKMEHALALKWLDRGEIERAIANDEFALHYQPTFDLATRAIVGAEGLIRWNHPTRGTVMPGEFIAFAERNGLIRSITSWVFARLVRDLTSRAAVPDRIRCYINVPAQQLDDPGFTAIVEAAIRRDPSLAAHIGFEITESSMMLNVRSSIATLETFRALGISIAIDDFGTGFSSLSYLKHLPADVIKIDQSFVRGVPNDEKDMTLADTFIWLANAFDFISLAEGIESEEQATWLAERGCRFGQGYLVARAMPFDSFVTMLGERPVAAA